MTQEEYRQVRELTHLKETLEEIKKRRKMIAINTGICGFVDAFYIARY